MTIEIHKPDRDLTEGEEQFVNRVCDTFKLVIAEFWDLDTLVKGKSEVAPVTRTATFEFNSITGEHVGIVIRPTEPGDIR